MTDARARECIDAALERPLHRGLIARGAGHSFGDAARRAGGEVVRTTGLDRLIAFDTETGEVTVEAGMTLGELMRVSAPHGWLPAVLPTTRFVTVGGAIAADIHGRNQEHDGSFSDHLLAMRIRTPEDVLTVSPEKDPELFWATTGGMGLTGFILEARLRLIPIETPWVRIRLSRPPSLDAVLAQLDSARNRSRYSVAWLDCLAPGGSLGRGVVMEGDHMPRHALDELGLDGRLEFRPGHRIRLPQTLPPLLRGARLRLFNELLYRAPALSGAERVESLSGFFHVHDRVDTWLHFGGPSGFVEYQFVVPPDRDGVVREVIERLRAARLDPLFAVLKRFGRETRGPLAFPGPGWMAGFDVPVRSETPQVLRKLDEVVAGAGGRLYLAKDARLRPEAFAAMYPGLSAWREVRARHDPRGVIRSDLGVRLEIA